MKVISKGLDRSLVSLTVANSEIMSLSIPVNHRSDPQIRAAGRKKKCSKCGEEGHTVRTCEGAKPQTEEDKLVTSFFINP